LWAICCTGVKSSKQLGVVLRYDLAHLGSVTVLGQRKQKLQDLLSLKFFFQFEVCF